MTPPTAGATPAVKPGRIDRARLEAASFPSILMLPIRFEDLDVLRHVNNVSVIALLQEGRVHFSSEMALPPLGDGLRTVVGAMNVEYAGEMIFPGLVEVRSGILAIGRTSYTFAQMIRQNGQSTVYSYVTMVITDAAGPAAIPEDYREDMARRCLILD